MSGENIKELEMLVQERSLRLVFVVESRWSSIRRRIQHAPNLQKLNYFGLTARKGQAWCEPYIDVTLLTKAPDLLLNWSCYIVHVPALEVQCSDTSVQSYRRLDKKLFHRRNLLFPDPSLIVVVKEGIENTRSALHWLRI